MWGCGVEMRCQGDSKVGAAHCIEISSYRELDSGKRTLVRHSDYCLYTFGIWIQIGNNCLEPKEHLFSNLFFHTLFDQF